MITQYIRILVKVYLLKTFRVEISVLHGTHKLIEGSYIIVTTVIFI